MKKGFLFALLALSLVGVPANAREKIVWFDTYDTNHDGLWTYDEFAAANQQYILTHPSEVKITTKELRRQFDDLDTDHDGVVKIEQVRTYHTWE
jgi:Ca2+-binding EF-hand superfamily protein